MKNLIMISALVLVGSQASAAKLETCINELQQSCGTFATLRGVLASDGLCSIVQAGVREDRTTFAKKIIFKDANTLLSFRTDTCRSARADIAGSFREQKQYKGRLFAVTADGRVVVVGRDNGLRLLINSKNKPYSSVIDIKIEGEIVQLTFENKQTLELDAKDVLEKVNHPSAALN